MSDHPLVIDEGTTSPRAVGLAQDVAALSGAAVERPRIADAKAPGEDEGQPQLAGSTAMTRAIGG